MVATYKTLTRVSTVLHRFSIWATSLLRSSQFISVVLASLIMLLIQLSPASVQLPLAFQRDAILHGEVWRLFTAELVHTNSFHLLLNLAAWWIIGYFSLTALRQWRQLLITALCGIGSGLGVLWGYPAIGEYVGLSGALHGVLMYAALCEWRHNRWLMTLVLVGLVAKIAHEQIAGGNPLIAKEIGARILIEGHLTGALSGLLLALLVMTWRHYHLANKQQ